MLSGPQGAAVVIGSSTLTNAVAEGEFAKIIQSELIQQGSTFGSAMQKAKAKFKSSYGDSNKDILWGISLLGDPALNL